MPITRGIRFEDTQFWVIHRRTEYGPFDYGWSLDLRGMELLYQGRKFGEVCGPSEFYADLKEFGLPLRVAEVASVVLGCIVVGVTAGWTSRERASWLATQLRALDCAEYAPLEG